MSGVTFRHYGPPTTRAVRDVVTLIYRDAYASAIASGDPFLAHEAFMRRFAAHTAHPFFDLVIAWAGDEPVAQAWGWSESAAAAAGQLRDAALAADDSFHAEGRTGTFALAEIMVSTAWRGQGVAHALHDELLLARTERQAELYVRPANVNAYRAYLKWGWHKVGETRPDLPDAPQFDVLILPLPIAR